MNDSLDTLNNTNDFFENDLCVINLITEEVVWKAGMFNPKSSNYIKYWFNEKNKK